MASTEEETKKMIARVDEEAERLRVDDKGLEALSLMEKGLVLRHSLYGKDGTELWDACKPMAELCNMLAMKILTGGDFSLSLELLKKAELLSERDRAAQASTFNNFAVYYRKIGKLHAALTFLSKCLAIEEELSAVGVADTHLNLCAVLSQLGQHEKALEHAQEALILLQEELYVNNPGDDDGSSSDRFSVLAIAFYNIGVEQEHMYQTEQSLRSYSKGAQVAARHLGEDSGITKTLRQSKEQVKQMLSGRGGGGSNVKLPPVRGR